MSLRIALFVSIFFIFCACNRNKKLDEAQNAALSQNEETKPPKKDKSTLHNKLLVTIQPDYSPEELQEEFSEYKLVVKSLTNKTMRTYLCLFDNKSIKPKELLTLLNDHQNIIEAKRVGNHTNKKRTMSTSNKASKVILEKQ